MPDHHWIDLPQLAHGPGDDLVHDRGVVPGAPGLYFVGLSFQYSLTSALIGGVDRDAAHVVQHLAREANSAHPAPVPAGTGSVTTR